MPVGMIKYKYAINTKMKILKYVGAVLKFLDHPVIGPILLGTCTIFNPFEEAISPHIDGFVVSMSQDGS